MPDKERNNEFSFDALSKKLEGQISKSSDDMDAKGDMRELTSHDIVGNIKSSSTSIVLFYRDECPYCKQLMPILDELADSYVSKVSFAKVNIDRIEQARQEFNVLGVPLVIAFKKGIPVGRIEGLRGVNDYDQWIESIHSGFRPMGLDEGPTTRLD